MFAHTWLPSDIDIQDNKFKSVFYPFLINLSFTRLSFIVQLNIVTVREKSSSVT